MKAILIQKCSDPMYWYAEKVGQYVPYIRTEDEYYWSREPAGYTNIVYKTDGILVELSDFRDPPSPDSIRVD